MKTDFRHRIEYKEYMETTQFSARITVLAAFWAVILCSYLFMFYYLQIVRGAHFAELAEANRIRRVNVPAPRGPILDRNGLVIARNRPAFEVLLTREKVRDVESMLRNLAPVIGVPEAELKERIARSTTPAYEPVVIGSDVSLAAASFIESRRADLPGIAIRMSVKRFYPEATLGSHFLGHVGEITRRMLEQQKEGELRQGDIVGRSGLEKTYGADLQGRRGERQVVVNSGGRVMEELAGGVPPVPGAAVQLTIDLNLQRELEAAFENRVGAAVFIDPRTGAILAMTSRPGFDPNFFARRFNRTVWKGLVDDPLDPMQNRAVQSAYSPGSTFKCVMAAAALEEGIVTESTVFNCAGAGSFHGRVFRCHERGGHGPIRMKEAIKKSCNIYFYNVGSRLGIDSIARYARHMGLGQTTGIDIEPESPGLIPSPEWKMSLNGERWYPSETISVSIGQGPISITPLQMAMVQGFIATNGLRVKPHLRAGAEALTGDQSYEVISRRSLQVIREAEWAVVNDHGTGWRAAIEGKDVCGKTGTAQVYAGSADLEDDEIPEAMRDHAWFVGFAPRDDARIAFAIIVEHGGHGGEAAAPIAQRVLDKFFGTKKKEPQEEVPEGQVAHAREAPESAF